MKYLFLHFGPGSHCKVEREVFGSRHNIVWWDQPVFSEQDQECLSELRRQAIDQLTRLYSENNDPVFLLANSYGAHLAVHVAKEKPEMISGISILGSQPNIKDTYLNLANFFIDKHQDLDLTEAKKKFEKNTTLETFNALLEEIIKIPDFMDHYWKEIKSENYNKWKKYQESGELFDFTTFNKIISCHFQEKTFDRLPNLLQTKFPVYIFLGANDPFCSKNEDIVSWRKVFPQAKPIEIDSGHFIHLESDASNWLLG